MLDPLLLRDATCNFERGWILAAPVRLAAVLFLLRHVAMSGVVAAALHRRLVLMAATTQYPVEKRTAECEYDRPTHEVSRTHVSFLADFHHAVK